jgi:integrase/recombinase XerD
MKRAAIPIISSPGQQAIEQYRSWLLIHEDLRPATLRNYVSDLRHFIAWCESTWSEGLETDSAFTPTHLSTPLLTHYRSHLQTVLRLKPNSVNRSLISLKRYCSWAMDEGLLARDPAKVVKLIPAEEPAPRHLDHKEEERLVTAVTHHGSLRDRTIITLLLHTGLRAHEICSLRQDQIYLGKRTGTIEVTGKRNKYREVPINSTARAVLEEYLATRSPNTIYLFSVATRGIPLSERTLGRIIAKYAALAHIPDLSPHDLRHRFGYRMAESTPLHRLAQIMGHDSLDTTMLYVKATKSDLQREVEKIAWA